MTDFQQEPSCGGPRALSRAEAAQFVFSRRPQIRAVARSVLSRWARALTSSEEVFSSVVRRVDTVAADNELRPCSPGQLWHLVRTITLHTAISKNRAAARLAQMVEESGYELIGVRDRIESCQSDEEAARVLARVAAALERGVDQELFALRFRGASYKVLADLLGTSEVAVRKRWSELCRRIRIAADEGKLDAD
jgi:DNA-directed RNA polymerase specialized sigma24 family protein